MISIDKLIQQLQQCKDNSVILPKMNESLFTQKTSFEIRKNELELLDTNFKDLNEANYTIEPNLENEKLQANNDKLHYNNEKTSYYNNNNKNKDSSTSNSSIIPSKSLIIYSENNTCTIPEIIINLFTSNIFKPSEWYIYGVKNPESFYKSFLLLFKTDFIIKNKTETKNEVNTFKREMAIQYESYYKKFNYRKMHFTRNDMINNLTNIDNYTEYDALQYIADYTKSNYIILDIINEKYIDIKCCVDDFDNTNYFIIIKYASNTYLPLMNSNGNHYFNIKILDIISKHFERTIYSKYKEPSMINLLNNSDADNEDNNDNNDNNGDKQDEHDDNQIIKTSLEYSYNVEDSLTIPITTIGYDSTILSHEPIIKTQSLISNISNISNIIDIEEEENEPLGFNNISNISNSSSVVTSNKCNSIDTLMFNIPMASDIKVKKTKKQIAIDEKLAKLEALKLIPVPVSETNPKSKPVSKIEKNKTDETETETETKTKSKSNNVKDVKDEKEEFKPLEKYNLVDLQFLAKFHKIDTQKMGSCNKKINKLKAELYEDIKKKM